LADFLATQRGRWVVLVSVVALFFVAAIVARVAARVSLTQLPRPTTRTDFLLAGPDETVDVAVEASTTPSADVLAGNLLEEQSFGSYQRTNQVVRVRYASTVPVVLGSVADLRPGTILQVHGRVGGTDGNLIVADKIVILTGNVSVGSPAGRSGTR
jgi:hypothetical protein